MSIRNTLIVLFGKTASYAVRLLNLGHGSTWPGHIALHLNEQFIDQTLGKSKTKIIIVAGTNGKTTTSRLTRTILEENGKSVLQNESGANLLNGIASAVIMHGDMTGNIKKDYAIFEVDENALPLALNKISPDYLVLLNLFRDQLDRYGEVNILAEKWRGAVRKLSDRTTLILCADDPQIAFLGTMSENRLQRFFSVAEKKNAPAEHAADTTHCPRCGEKLRFRTITFSHLGDWHCPSCNLRHPTPELSSFPYSPLSGTYNRYNTNAAVLLAKTLGLSDGEIITALKKFTPAFGRQETLSVDGKRVQILLSKNPTGLNESLRTVRELKGENVLLILNDGAADGRDVSWIWDVDFEEFVPMLKHITVSGERAYDMGVRIKYALDKWQMADGRWQIEESLQTAINHALDQTATDKTLYILPTYTAMLATRKILTGKKIL